MKFLKDHLFLRNTIKKSSSFFVAVLLFLSVTSPALAIRIDPAYCADNRSNPGCGGLTQTQISSILALLKSFGADDSVISNVSAALNGRPTTDIDQPSACIDLSHNLYSGSTDSRTNGDVTRLQQFLNVNATGYFGPATEQAVQDWQSSHGVVTSGSPDTTGYGYVGAKTRKAMGCGKQVRSDVATIAITSTLPSQGSVDVFLRVPSKYVNPYVVYILNPVTPSQPVSSGTLLGMAYNSSGKDVDGYTAHLALASAHEGFAVNQGGVHWFPVPSGKYYVTAVVYPFSPFKPGTDMEYMDIGTEPVALTYVDSQPFDIVNNIAGSGIRVTAPNGGEQWQEGVLNTVTWSPYQYNPDINPAKDVTAYLEKKNSDGTFTTLGKVQESGKASIHWITGELNSATQGGNLAPTGDGYYIRVVNNVTGATDRSDAPFRLLPTGGTIQVNGSDGPLTLVKDQKVNVSWSSYNTNSCWISGLKSTQGGSDLSISHVASNGNQDAYYSGVFNVILDCQKNSGGEITDVIAVNPSNSSSVRILSPNGGENLEIGKRIDIEYHLEGIKSVSVALYKNDTWQKWIVKDSFIGDSGSTNMGFSWTPDEAQADGSKVYKIYVTGQKADGTGYVDDKSDAPFGFIGMGARPTATVDQSSLTATANTSLTISGTATGVASVRVAIGHTQQNFFTSSVVPVINGRWQVQDSMGLPADSYSVGVQGFTDVAGNQPVTNAGEGGLLTGSTLTVSSTNTTAPTITMTGTTRPSITFSYANIPTSDIQGIVLVGTNSNVATMATQGGTGTGSMLVPDSAPAGRYFLRVLARMNNATIVESAPFDLPALVPITVAPTATLLGYANYEKDAFMTNPGLTQAQALMQCQNTAANNTWVLRCVWNGQEIFNDIGTKVANLEVYTDTTNTPIMTQTGVSLPQALSNCNFGHVVMRCVWGGETLFTNTNTTTSNSTITGFLDEVRPNGDGTYSVLGWACSTGFDQSIGVHLYIGGEAGTVGSSIYTKAIANLPSEASVAQACSSHGTNNRFNIRLGADAVRAYAGKLLAVHGISPVGKSNLMIKNEHQLVVPSN